MLTARGMDGYHRSDGEPNELTYVDMDTFLATFRRSPADVVSGTVRACRDRHAQSRRNDAWFADFSAARWHPGSQPAGRISISLKRHLPHPRFQFNTRRF